MNYKGKRVLVAGSTGLAGMALTRRLAEQGARVRATVFRAPPPEKLPGVEYVSADLTRQEDCRRAVQGMEFAIIAAATSSGAAKISATPLIHVTPNVVLNALLLEECYRARVGKVLYLSSTTSYPDAGSRPLKEEEFFDGDPYDAYFPVGWMKRYTEVLCRMYSTKLKPPMCAQAVRPTNIYGPHDDFGWETSHVLAALVRKVVERHQPIEVWGTGDDVRDLIYVDDLAEACLSVLEKSETYDPVNIGLGKGHSVKEVLALACELDGYKDARVAFNAEKPSMIPVRLVDVSRAEAKYGFRAKTSLREGLARTIRWYREHRSSAKQ